MRESANFLVIDYLMTKRIPADCMESCYATHSLCSLYSCHKSLETL